MVHCTEKRFQKRYSLGPLFAAANTALPRIPVVVHKIKVFETASRHRLLPSWR
jgi:hypothetical protein